MTATSITADYLKAHPLPTHAEGGDKQLRGRVLVVAGSIEVPGAALLAGLGALRAGAGVLQIATVKTAAPHLAMAMPEARVVPCVETSSGDIDPANVDQLVDHAGNADTVLIGPGMLDPDAALELTCRLLKAVNGPAYVLDAAAFTSLRDCPEQLHAHDDRIVVTPHAGEMAKFLRIERDTIERDPLNHARQAATRIKGTVALKGASTHIVDAQGNAWLSDHGSIGLGTSGSGDTLAGILAGLLARGASPSLAALWAVYLHAEAGQRLAAQHGPLGLLAREIPDQIPRIMADFAGGNGAQR